jgi:hypothetical protein
VGAAEEKELTTASSLAAGEHRAVRRANAAPRHIESRRGHFPIGGAKRALHRHQAVFARDGGVPKFQISISFDGGVDEAEELITRMADAMREHTRHQRGTKVGYVVALAQVDEPDDHDDYLDLVMGGAYMAFIGATPDEST